jgi:hypothetical protein
MTIDIGGGVEEEVTVYDGDEPKEIAMSVVNKHKLDNNIMKIIEENIKHNLILVKSGKG